MGAKYTVAQAYSSKKYLTNFDEIKIRIPKGDKDKYKQVAAEQDKSLNQFIIDCIEKEMA